MFRSYGWSGGETGNYIMNDGSILAFCGEARGKTAAALGIGIREASRGKSVVMVRFLKGKSMTGNELFSRLEPEFRVFSFEKYTKCFQDLSEEEKRDEVQNIRNALNYANKVLVTGQCDLLILDEALRLFDNDIISVEEFTGILSARPEGVSIIMTGTNIPDEIAGYTDEIIYLGYEDYLKEV